MIAMNLILEAGGGDVAVGFVTSRIPGARSHIMR